MDKKIKKQEVEEKTLELKEVPFEEQLTEAVGQSVEQFYKDLLKKADETIKAQRVQLRDFSRQQIAFRDEVALACYVPLIANVDDYKKAASDAFRAADAFLRVRESGDTIID